MQIINSFRFEGKKDERCKTIESNIDDTFVEESIELNFNTGIDLLDPNFDKKNMDHNDNIHCDINLSTEKSRVIIITNEKLDVAQKTRDVGNNNHSNNGNNNNNTNENATKSYVLKGFCYFLPYEINCNKRCYFPCATHIIDQATDIAVIYEFWQIFRYENRNNGNEMDCKGINGDYLFILSLCSFFLYRIVSSIWVYISSRSLFHTLLQFFDLKIFHALYINFISNHSKGPNSAQKDIQVLEASWESFPQITIQLVYFIKLNLIISNNFLVFISLIFSIYNVSTKMISEDSIYFIQEWQNARLKCKYDGYGCCINGGYITRFLIRLLDVTQRVLLILLIWIILGGKYALIYVGWEAGILIIAAVLTQKYVLVLILVAFGFVYFWYLLCLNFIVYLCLFGFLKHHFKSVMSFLIQNGVTFAYYYIVQVHPFAFVVLLTGM